MLPTIVSHEIETELKDFLVGAFPMATKGFARAGKQSLLEQFWGDNPKNLLQGPWLEIKTPFRTKPQSQAEPLPFNKLTLGFAPYYHQHLAFQRLTGALPQSTIIATGTGSGKTECFMLPILDYCLTERRPGIKAIIIYPMNALAIDQATRFAEEVAKLPTKLSVGLYVGDKSYNYTHMGPEHIIGDRDTLQQNPPDILLTNYKMLDFLLMRDEDQPLWRHNFSVQGLLKYLVVDELHTFDGAQGTDLACLIRRLKNKLHLGDELACVGTSATLGGEDSKRQLLDYASQIFSTQLDADAIIGEHRLGVDEYLEQFATAANLNASDLTSALPEATVEELQPGQREQGAYLRALARLWFGENLALDAPEGGDEYNSACVKLGELLHRHTAFINLLKACHERANIHELAETWKHDYSLPSVEYARWLLESLGALVSTARIWRDDTHTKVAPFLSVRVQMWVRELRRMLASVCEAPSLVHADDLTNTEDPLHLPVVHCRECQATAWGALNPQGERKIIPDPQRFYEYWFSESPDAALLYPAEGHEQTNREGMLRQLCTACFELNNAAAKTCSGCKSEDALLAVWLPHLTKTTQDKVVRSDRCPQCLSDNGLSILGSRVASLASTIIGKLFGSHYNQDHKLIAFSDSVQDAAHRAGFFAARTYLQTLRNALAQAARELTARAGHGYTLQDFMEQAPLYWRDKLPNEAEFVATFIAPNMLWLNDYQKLKATGTVPQGNLAELVHKRLSWEVMVEFSQRAHRGRTLERTQVAGVAPSNQAMETLARKVAEVWHEEIGTLQGVSEIMVRRFLVGVLHMWRLRGAFNTPELQRYAREGGVSFLLNQYPWMPGYGLAARPPAAIATESISPNFINLMPSSALKNQHPVVQWFNKLLAQGGNIFASAEYQQAMVAMVKVMEREKWLTAIECRGRTVWLMNLDKWVLNTHVYGTDCSHCKQRHFITPENLVEWQGMPCLQLRCQGTYTMSANPIRQAYNAYPRRLVACEHTALIEDSERKAVEDSFKRGHNAWDVNLLSATPTLEMGIDIGDLSSVLLCSVPPGQANYLQRIGRAGRKNGNALALTIANGNNHDNYFYQQPLEMIAGDVQAPGVFLNATAVLERQLVAFTFDRWVGGGEDNKIPRRLANVLANVANRKNNTDVFPFNWFAFVAENRTVIYHDFIQMFPELDEQGRAHLQQFIGAEGEGEEIFDTIETRILGRLQQLQGSFDSNKKQIDALKKNIDELKKTPIDEATKVRLDESEAERQALMALNRAIRDQFTLNFFTDEGLLPNYAFPEEGVTLSSVIVRQRVKDAEGESQPSNISFKFQRPAQAALGELAPENSFYVSEHKISIDQVDLNLSEQEVWRLCAVCHYSEAISQEAQHSACPRCGSPQWADEQQKHTLLKLRQVYARAHSRFDRISDDAEQREPRFYVRQLLVDIDPNTSTKAWSLNHKELPFGFEYVPQATFREINFGEQQNSQTQFAVAGEERVRKGFQICRQCGKVKRKKSKHNPFPHALGCPLSREGATEKDEEWLESLYLYRELKSEAIRILLPLADVAESAEGRASLGAALRLGLQEYYRGAVDHLNVVSMDEPSSTGLKKYLVIYDRVPGGSGYLKQLMLEPNEFFSMLEMAYNKIADCSCKLEHNPDTGQHKDGCYRCLLAYHSQRENPVISRQFAENLLARILEQRENITELATLREVDTNTLLESELERRFVAALRNHFQVTKRLVGHGKTGYLIFSHDGTTKWELEPQVEFGREQGVDVATRADFVLRPYSEKDRSQHKELVIYTDGFEYHRDIVAEDIRKRMALMRAGYQVLTLTWHDVPDARTPIDKVFSTFQGSQIITRMLANLQSPYGKFIDQYQQAFNTVSLGEAQTLVQQGPYSLLVQWINNAKIERKRLMHAAVFSQLLTMMPPPAFEPIEASANAENISHADYLARQFAQGQVPHTLGGELWHHASFVKRDELREMMRELPPLNTLLLLDNRQVSEQADSPFAQAWRDFWLAANLLQFGTRLSLGLHAEVLAGQPVEAATEPKAEEPEQEHTSLPAWKEEFKELTLLEDEDANAVLALDLPEPIIGEDLSNNEGEVLLSNVELLWPEQKVALLMEGTGQALQGWVLISTDDDNWLEALGAAFTEIKD